MSLRSRHSHVAVPEASYRGLSGLGGDRDRRFSMEGAGNTPLGNFLLGEGDADDHFPMGETCLRGNRRGPGIGDLCCSGAGGGLRARTRRGGLLGGPCRRECRPTGWFRGRARAGGGGGGRGAGGGKGRSRARGRGGVRRLVVGTYFGSRRCHCCHVHTFRIAKSRKIFRRDRRDAIEGRPAHSLPFSWAVLKSAESAAI